MLRATLIHLQYTRLLRLARWGFQCHRFTTLYLLTVTWHAFHLLMQLPIMLPCKITRLTYNCLTSSRESLLLTAQLSISPLTVSRQCNSCLISNQRMKPWRIFCSQHLAEVQLNLFLQASVSASRRLLVHRLLTLTLLDTRYSLILVVLISLVSRVM